jgi:hypothetical protein
MNPEERLKLKKQYESFPDEQLLQMLAEGAGAYVKGAYELLQAEAQNRGLKIKDPGQPEEKIDREEAKPPVEPELDVNTYVQIAIINHDSDRAFIESIFSTTDIPYFLQNLNFRRAMGLPVALMVDQAFVEEAVELLKDFKPSGSILLW